MLHAIHGRAAVGLLALSTLSACAWMPFVSSPTEPATSKRVVAEADHWDLSAIYPDQAAFDADLVALDARLPKLAACQGQLGKSADYFKRCLDLYSDSWQQLNQLGAYASMLKDEDTRVAKNLQRLQTVQLAQARLNEAVSFIKPEVLSLGRTRLDRLLASDAALDKYRHTIDNILRMAPHTLDREGEALMATLSLSEGSTGSAYRVLSNADMPWPTLEIDGQSIRLDQAAYTKYRSHPDRAVRQQVFDAFWGTWKKYERTTGVLLYGNVLEHVAQARARDYASARDAALAQAAIPGAVYDSLIAQTHAHLDTLQRYFKLRGRMLGIADLRYHDIYPPLVSSDQHYPLALGKQLTLDALAPLGDDYVRTVRHGFDSRWMDAYPAPGKSSGAYMNPGAYAVHPYVLMNYNDNYASVSTLAHEWGHALHSVLASREQDYLNAGYSIFTAEIASTVNELLLLEHMLEITQDDELRLYYLGNALENLRGTYFRQAMFGEFESLIHTQVENGESLSGESLSRDYCQLLKQYHGHDQGVLTISDRECIEWAYIPHFYYNFYVYQYATSIAAGSLFAQRILDGQPGARQEYLDMLAAGGSDYPYDLLKRAGIDMATAAPYNAIAARMNGIMDEIESILDQRKD